MKEKYVRIIAAIVIIATGVMIAICGAGSTLDLYLGITAVVAGVVLTVLNFAMALTSKKMSFPLLFVSVSLIAIGISFFTHYISFAVLINVLVLATLGLGIALMAFGLFTMIATKKIPYGAVMMVLGAAVIAVVIVYLNVPEFRQAFWIITGVIVAVYGAIELVFALIPPKDKAQIQNKK